MKTNFYGMEKVSLVDMEGYVVCTLFTNNCNFRCPFCHNGPLVLNKVDSPLDFNEILYYLTLRKNVLDGVCISGGEPTLMIDLPQYLKKIKELGLLIKLDTNGTNPEMLHKLIEEKLVDYIAMDIKNNLKDYPKTVGIEKLLFKNIENNILKSINILKNSHIKYEFRTTLVKEFHNDDNIKFLGELLKDSDILYLQHFISRDTCLQNNLHEIKKEKALEYQNFLKSYIKDVKLRGY